MQLTTCSLLLTTYYLQLLRPRLEGGLTTCFITNYYLLLVLTEKLAYYGRASQVTFEGEGAQDVGGPYREAEDTVEP